MIILQDEFKKQGYMDLLMVEDALEYGIDLSEIFDADKRPIELLGLFISKQKDDLFFVLNGDIVLKENDEKPMDTLCDVWDNRIRVFTIINGKSETIRKLKYNIVLLIVYSSDRPDKSQEGNLMITRKIFIRGDMAVKDQIEIADEEVIDLPFNIIPSDEFIPNLEKTRKLNQLTACDEELLKYLKEKHQRNRVRSKASITNKSIPDLDYNKIKEWLQHDHS